MLLSFGLMHSLNPIVSSKKNFSLPHTLEIFQIADGILGYFPKLPKYLVLDPYIISIQFRHGILIPLALVARCVVVVTSFTKLNFLKLVQSLISFGELRPKLNYSFLDHSEYGFLCKAPYHKNSKYTVHLIFILPSKYLSTSINATILKTSHLRVWQRILAYGMGSTHIIYNILFVMINLFMQ